MGNGWGTNTQHYLQFSKLWEWVESLGNILARWWDEVDEVFLAHGGTLALWADVSKHPMPVLSELFALAPDVAVFVPFADPQDALLVDGATRRLAEIRELVEQSYLNCFVYKAELRELLGVVYNVVLAYGRAHEALDDEGRVHRFVRVPHMLCAEIWHDTTLCGRSLASSARGMYTGWTLVLGVVTCFECLTIEAAR